VYTFGPFCHTYVYFDTIIRLKQQQQQHQNTSKLNYAVGIENPKNTSKNKQTNKQKESIKKAHTVVSAQQRE